MLLLLCSVLFFFFKQKTAYEMRISDWSSDVCSSDLDEDLLPGDEVVVAVALGARLQRADIGARPRLGEVHGAGPLAGDQLCKEIGRASCRERVCQYV